MKNTTTLVPNKLAIFQVRVHHATGLGYSVEQIANLLECSENRVIRALLSVGMNGLPDVMDDVDLLLYPCSCGKGMMRGKDDVGCALCWEEKVDIA